MLSLGLFLPLVLTALTVSWHNHDIRTSCFRFCKRAFCPNIFANHDAN